MDSKSCDSTSISGEESHNAGNLDEQAGDVAISDKVNRLISWNVDILTRLLKHVVARRRATGIKQVPANDQKIKAEALLNQRNVIDEVKEIINLPKYNYKERVSVNPESIELPVQATDQLRDLVTSIAKMYRDNPFHNFEHA